MGFLSGFLQHNPCTGYMEYPFENKQGKSCSLNLSCVVDKIEAVRIPWLDRVWNRWFGSAIY
jgi:hypothetical protein